MGSLPLEPESSASASFTTLALQGYVRLDDALAQRALFTADRICVSAPAEAANDLAVDELDGAFVFQSNSSLFIIQ